MDSKITEVTFGEECCDLIWYSTDTSLKSAARRDERERVLGNGEIIITCWCVSQVERFSIRFD